MAVIPFWLERPLAQEKRPLVSRRIDFLCGRAGNARRGRCQESLAARAGWAVTGAACAAAGLTVFVGTNLTSRLFFHGLVRLDRDVRLARRAAMVTRLELGPVALLWLPVNWTGPRKGRLLLVSTIEIVPGGRVVRHRLHILVPEESQHHRGDGGADLRRLPVALRGSLPEAVGALPARPTRPDPPMCGAANPPREQHPQRNPVGGGGVEPTREGLRSRVVGPPPCGFPWERGPTALTPRRRKP